MIGCALLVVVHDWNIQFLLQFASPGRRKRIEFELPELISLFAEIRDLARDSAENKNDRVRKN